MNILFDLFLTFAKIGLFTFGGGYAMISLIHNECVDHKHWIDDDTMSTLTVIAESTPGPIAINAATFIGYKKGGLLGSIIATLGMVLPSFIIIYLISLFFTQFMSYEIVDKAFQGIKIGVSVLILDAGLKMYKKMKKTSKTKIICYSSLTAIIIIELLSLNVSSISILIIAAIFSLLYKGGKV